MSVWCFIALILVPVNLYAERSTLIARWGEGPSRTVCVTEDLMLRSEGAFLEVWSLAETTLLGRLLLPSSITDLETKDGFALVLTVDHGLFMVDLADPEAPVVDNSIPISNAIKLILQNDIAFIGAGYWFYWGGPSYIEIVDVSDLQNPQLIEAGVDGFPLACTDSLLFTVVIGDIVLGVWIWDVSDPYSVSYLGSTENGIFPATAFSQNDLLWILGECELQVWDIVEPTVPILISEYTGLDLNQQLARRTNPFARGDTLYFYDSTALRRLDISQPDTVVELTAFSCPGIVDFFPSENSVWTAGGDRGVTQAAITDQDSLQILGQFSSIGTPQRVVSDGDKLVVQANHIHIFQTEEEDSVITAVTSLELETGELMIHLADELVYISGPDQLRIIDIEEPTEPFQTGLLELSGITELFFQNDLLYIYFQDQSVGIVDVADPENPLLLYSLVIGEIEEMAVTEGRLALLINDAQVLFFDISEPGQMIYMGQPPLAGEVEHLAIHNDHLIIAVDEYRLHLYDVATLDDPVLLVDRYFSCSSNSRLIIADGFLYGWETIPTNFEVWINMFDLNDLETVDYFDWESAPLDISVTEERVNLIYDNHGLVVVENDAYDSTSNSNTATPDQLYLSHNYPNPFNPSTTIEFTLPFPLDVQLTVYNILGQQVQLLADHAYSAGVHQVRFDGSTLSSGVYIYRLSAANQVLTRKMVLVR